MDKQYLWPWDLGTKGAGTVRRELDAPRTVFGARIGSLLVKEKVMKKIGMFCVVLMALASVASATVLWSEDFQGFVKDDAIGIPDQDATWALTSNTDNYHCIIQDSTYWGPEFIPAGDKVMQVDSITSASGNFYATATKTLPALGASQNVLTFKFDLTSGWGGTSWRAVRIWTTVGGSSGNIADLFMETNYAAMELNGVATGLDNTGAWYNYEFVMDFDADTVTLVRDGVPGVTAPMSADFSASDVQTIACKTLMYYKAGRQALGWWDDMSISEVPEPMTMSLLAFGGLALIRRRK